MAPSSSKYQLLALLPASIAILCVGVAAYIVLSRRDAAAAAATVATGTAKLPTWWPFPNRRRFGYKPTRPTVVEELESEVDLQVVTSPATLRVHKDSASDSGGISSLVRGHGGARRKMAGANSSPSVAAPAEPRSAVSSTAPLRAPKVQERVPLTVKHNLVHTTRSRKFTFESAARDTTIYPTPSYYRLDFPKLLRNVIAVTLNVAVFPVSEYNVNVYNQWIDIEEGGIVYEVQIPAGFYPDITGPDLVAFGDAVELAITTTSPALAAYTVDQDDVASKLTVNSNGAPFRFLFFSGPNVNRSAWRVVGYPRLDTALAVSHLSPGIVDLLGTLAIDLFVEELTNSVEGSLARIDLNRQSLGGATYFTPTEVGSARYFWPIGKLQFMTFQFLVATTEIVSGEVVQTYRPYLFNGRQHTMQFSVVTREYRNVLEDDVELDPQL
jgi:hypothetical protein